MHVIQGGACMRRPVPDAGTHTLPESVRRMGNSKRTNANQSRRMNREL